MEIVFVSEEKITDAFVVTFHLLETLISEKLEESGVGIGHFVTVGDDDHIVQVVDNRFELDIGAFEFFLLLEYLVLKISTPYLP
ncbi:hypothetical protein D1872_333530 [compost metagenome]